VGAEIHPGSDEDLVSVSQIERFMFYTHFEKLAASVRECAYTALDGDLTGEQALNRSHDLIRQTKQHGGIVYVIGNGGSAGIASHFSNDLMKSLQVPSQTLYDTNILTCLANDIGYENAFAYCLQRLLKPHDLLVAISSSGKSPNILNAVYVARARRTPVITLSGFHETNPLRSLGHLNFWIDSKDYGLVESAHFFLLHTIVDLWNKQVADYAQIIRNIRAPKDQVLARHR
jgi:D-sedoheptulose 7-phosphate isomerase